MSTTDNDPETIAKEYQEWKKTTPMLYGTVVTHTLAWPTLTCQWLPNLEKKDGHVHQELMLGTHTSDQEPNELLFQKVSLPNTQENTTTVDKKARISVGQRIRHDREVNRARYQPSQPQHVATMTPLGDVLILNRTAPPSEECLPMLRLQGHTREGYGLAWSPHSAGANHLLSAGYDKIVCHWDIEHAQDKARPYQVYQGHGDCVEDVSWNAVVATCFASVGDDRALMIWDTRRSNKAAQRVLAHEAEVNSVCFHPSKEWMLATGSADKTIGLFDTRRIDKPLHFIQQEDPVTQVSWSPHQEAILASAAGRQVILWDLRRIGEEQTPEDAEDGPPELMFLHGGHTAPVSEFSWNPSEPWMMASTAEDNSLQVWQMSKNIYCNTDASLVAAMDLEY
ncbi:WD40-repeat-containing domain protein [Spinellus fusiger]|nr:WD40-repeat-containing domain protein [Spinellus fusiger]